MKYTYLLSFLMATWLVLPVIAMEMPEKELAQKELHNNSTQLAIIQESPKSRLKTEDGEDLNEQLLQAVGRGTVKEVRKLLARGADVNTRNSCKDTPLYIAIKRDNPEIIKLLLEQPDIKVNLKGGYSNTTPLVEAVYNNKQEIVKLLLAKQDIDVNMLPDYYQWAPLYCAVMNNNLEIANLLLVRPDINLNKKSSYGFRALDRALIRNNPNMIKLLLNHQSTPPQVAAALRTLHKDGSTYFSCLPRDLIEMLMLYHRTYSISKKQAKKPFIQNKKMKELIASELAKRSQDNKKDKCIIS